MDTKPIAKLLVVKTQAKDDEVVRRDIGRLPCPAPSQMVHQVEKAFLDSADSIEVVVHSNRFGRSFRLRVPLEVTPSFVLGMLRDTLNLKWSNVDESLGVELSYTYGLRHNGEALGLKTPLGVAGVKDGDRLELWIKVTLRDLIEDKDIGEKVFFSLYGLTTDKLTDDLRRAREHAFSSAEITRIAQQFFEHVDQ